MLTYADVRYGEHDSTTAATEMLPDAEAAAAGAAEAVMLVNEFLVARIAQSNASSYARNTLTLTLATRAPLLSGTWVTIAGLDRASTDSTDSLPLAGNGSGVFGSAAKWSKPDTSSAEGGFLVLRVLNASAAHVYYRITFVLNNSGGEQHAAAGGAADAWNTRISNATSLLVVSTKGSVKLLERVLRDGNGNTQQPHCSV
jgi:hypothetical protein